MEIVHRAAPCRNVPVTFTLNSSMKAQLLIGVASFFTTLVLIILLAQIPGSAGWPLRILASAAGASAEGLAYGMLLRRKCAVVVGVGAFIAALLASVPVVLITYGVALITVPLLAAFALLAAVSVEIGRYFGRRGHAA